MPQPAFEPTDVMRGQVKTMAGYGVPYVDIAAALKITAKTLVKYFPDELAEGRAVANVKIGESLYFQAVGRPAEIDRASAQVVREEMKPDKSVAIFLGKVRLGMREVSRVEVDQVGGASLQMIDLDLSVFTDDELRLFMELYEKARRRSREIAETIVSSVALPAPE